MPETVVVRVSGKRVEVRSGTSAAVAAVTAGTRRTSVTGEPRGPLCGMGICFECRMKINGKLHVKSCQVVCADGMEIEANE